MRFPLLGLLFLPCLALAAAAPTIPSESEQKTLARDSILAFDQAVKAKDFTSFYNKISKLWQGQTKAEELKKIFQSFIDQGIDLAGVAQADPDFSEPAQIDKDGVLTLQGRYPMRPSTADFRLKYIQEKNAWKLIGFKVDVEPAGGRPEKAPTLEEARELVRDSLLAFNASVQAKDFTGFHKEVAVLWQEKTTPEKLQGFFQSFIDQEIDISSIARLTPVFEPEPAINDNGLFEVKGHYPTQPNRLRFALTYLYEASKWKLVGIKVNVDPAEEAEKAENESDD